MPTGRDVRNIPLPPALLRRGEFTSRDDLMTQIDEFTIRHNATAHPYLWRYEARAEHAHYLSRRDRERAINKAACQSPT